MNLSCGTRTIKYLMFAFNFFFVISGIVITAVGATIKTVYTDYEDLLDSQYFTLPNMLIATGIFIFFISFLGCCGAFKQSWVMLAIFSLFLCVIFLFEFASGIAGYVLRDKTYDYLDSTLRRDLLLYNTTTHAAWDLIQQTFECCGVDDYTDWKEMYENYELPISCCPAMSGTTGVFYCNSFNVTTATSTEATSAASTETAASTTASSNETTPSSNETSTTTVSPSVSDRTAASTVIPQTTASNASETTSSSIETTTTATTVNNFTIITMSARRKRREVDDTASTPSAPTTSYPYTTGCKTAFGDFLKKHAVQIGGCALALAVIQMAGIAFSIHLVRQLRTGYP